MLRKIIVFYLFMAVLVVITFIPGRSSHQLTIGESVRTPDGVEAMVWVTRKHVVFSIATGYIVREAERISVDEVQQQYVDGTLNEKSGVYLEIALDKHCDSSSFSDPVIRTE